MNGFEFGLQMILVVSALGFMVGLRMLASPKTARLGNFIAAMGMIAALIITIIIAKPENSYLGLFVSILLGSIIGVVAAYKIEMTAMPQMVAIFNGLGGAASVLVAAAEMNRYLVDSDVTPTLNFTLTSWFSVIIGGITLSGSIFAFGKLQDLVSTKPILYPGQRVATMVLFISCFVGLFWLIIYPQSALAFWGCTLISILLGCLLVIPIGGADMPVVISLLNSYSGIAASAAGFVVSSKILIISGALVGASGIILTRLMCQAMNRSLLNVIFGAFGGVDIDTDSDGPVKAMKEFIPMDAALSFSNSNKVVFVPGYGLAVSQAQHNIRDLANLLKENSIEVFYAIHPVAGRMPGHMNVLLAEADIPYEELKDLEEINGEFETTDVAVIIGANDVVNPSARTDKKSPLFGMPILNADKAKNVIVMKRGKGRGFAGVENPLFTMDHTGVVFGDAKKSLISIITEYKQL